MAAGWAGDIEQLTESNDTFRTVVFTGSQLQLTVMHLQPGEEIGVELHDELDQFIRVESGEARITLGPSATEVSTTHDLRSDGAAIIPGGTWHKVVNVGPGPLRLYSIYGPPEHPDGAVHTTRAEADAAEAEHGH